MFISDVHKKDEIRNIATQDLRKIGLKYRQKKFKLALQDNKKTTKCFKIHLHMLPTQLVTLNDGQQLVVPTVLHALCTFVLLKMETEGIFRKEGSKSRQQEIKNLMEYKSYTLFTTLLGNSVYNSDYLLLSLNAGCRIQGEYHVIDVAVILKTFLRELPEPLIPLAFHEYFLRCTLLEKHKLDAILLLCLMLPMEHLNTLAYLLRFFNTISKHADTNKMNSYNLAVVIGPNIIPFHEKSTINTQHKLTKICELVQLLIDNANKIGIIPEHIIDHVGNFKSSEDDLTSDKKKKRRSGSLTRMFNGLKKIVGNKTDDSIPSAIVTPDLLLTPSINGSVKKRKVDLNGLSTKKKKDLIDRLPEKIVLNTPFTPIRTPISGHPNPRNDKLRAMDRRECNTEKTDRVKHKKSHWPLRNKNVKNARTEDDITSRRNSMGPRTLLERRWSAVSQVANFRKNKRNSFTAPQHYSKKEQFKQPSEVVNISKENASLKSQSETHSSTEPDYVRVPKIEYEEIKNRVSAIERRISIEIDNMESQATEPISKIRDDNIKNVQTAYEQVLDQSEPLCLSTDQLAKRLSRGLKIRQSSEHVRIRSPSARKIGSLRRRSKELEKQNSKITRTQSWHVSTDQFAPKVNLRRGKPNTVQTGLPTTLKNEDMGNMSSANNTSTPNLPGTKRFLRSSLPKNNDSFRMSTGSSLNSQNHSNFSGNSSVHWTSAEGFFYSIKSPNNTSANGRPSLAKLRSQNAGMVLAKAKLFDNVLDSDTSGSVCTNRSNKTPRQSKISYKIGANRNSDIKISQRIRILRGEDKRTSKNNMSPRRRACNLSNKEKLILAKQLTENNSILNSGESSPVIQNAYPYNNTRTKVLSPMIYTPKNAPLIKKALLSRSPKRLCRTPNCRIDRSTPLKVLNTPKSLHY